MYSIALTANRKSIAYIERGEEKNQGRKNYHVKQRRKGCEKK
jgi:hypothetical protein